MCAGWVVQLIAIIKKSIYVKIVFFLQYTIKFKMKRLRPNDDASVSQKSMKCDDRCVRFDASSTTTTSKSQAAPDVWQQMVDDFRTHFADEYM
jgi:hypothetical protein